MYSNNHFVTSQCPWIGNLGTTWLGAQPVSCGCGLMVAGAKSWKMCVPYSFLVHYQAFLCTLCVGLSEHYHTVMA
jgi:hypothetical protein